MRLARFTQAGRTVVHAGRADGHWVALPAPLAEARPVGLLAASHRQQVLDLLATQPALDPEQVALDHAPAVAGDGPDESIWGAGLNYRGHARDLETAQPESGPGSYLRPGGCLIGNGQPVELPSQSKRVTAEAELGLVIGTTCKNVPRQEWRQVVAAVTSVLDMTAEDVIRENPRYIPWAKGFDTFCSIGPQLVSLDEFGPDALDQVLVSTVCNDTTIASAPVSDMRYGLGYLVEYFTAGRTLPAGTVLCTGTPGAVVIQPGDHVEARVAGVGTLRHPVC
ncbi:MAG TPA: fumarylacetoacetate hydrolase family protein [Kineosporiaceae bacterium]